MKGHIIAMKFLRILLIALLSILISVGSCVFYAFKIEPYRLVVNEYHLTEQKEDSEVIKIV